MSAAFQSFSGTDSKYCGTDAPTAVAVGASVPEQHMVRPTSYFALSNLRVAAAASILATSSSEVPLTKT